MRGQSVPLRRLFLSATGGSWGADPDDGEQWVLPCIRGTDFDYPHLRTNLSSAPLRAFTPSDVASRSARRGDLIIEKSGGGEQQPVGRVVLHDLDELVMPTNFAGRLRPAPEVDPRFACYLMASLYSDGRTRAAIKQTTGIQNLDLDALLSVRVSRPTMADQRAIADCLDDETARIDALIEKKRRMIELLDNRRRAIFDRLTVPSALGGVADRQSASPWPITKLKRVADFFTDGDWIEAPYITADGIRLIQTGNVGEGDFREQGFRYVSDATFRALNCTEVYPGDVLISRLAGPVGCACLAPDLGVRMIAAVDVAILRLRPGVDPSFVVAYLTSTRHLAFAELLARGTTMQRLSRSQVGEMPLPLPDVETQQMTANELAGSVERLRTTRELVSRQITLLVEHRQALITAAVTGQLDIPGVAA